jgi:AraC-like DNA-binding protein
MSTLHSSLYAAALVSCLMLLAIYGTWRRSGTRTTFLLVLLLLQSLNFGFEWLMANPSTPAKSLWLALVMALAFLLAPSLWLFARAATEVQTVRIRDLSPWHAAPIALGWLFLVPLVLSTHMGSEFERAEGLGVNAHQLPIHATMLASIALFALQAPYYLHLCTRMLTPRSGIAQALFADVRDRQRNALRVLVFVVTAHWIVGIARAVHCLLLGKDAGYVVLFAICEVMFTLWAAIVLVRGGATVESGDAKYARSALDRPARDRIIRKLGDAWNVQHLHRNSQLTLRLLSQQLRENPHYVSQVINQDLGTSFYDLVNRHRISDAMAAIRQNADRPLLEIALEVGFNSKSTFNAAFRQHAGVTPSAYRGADLRRAEATSDPSG